MDRQIISFCLFIFFISSVFTKNVSPAVIETSKPRTSSASKPKAAELQPDAIIYPTDPIQGGTALEKLADSESSTNPPSPCPQDAPFCESADDYPEALIKKNLKKQPKVLLDVLYEEEIEDVHNKLGPDFEIEKELCASSSKIIYPKKGKSKEGIFEFIVNDDEHKQGVKVETCRNSGGECSELPANILPLGYKSSCVQRTIQRIMVVFNSTSNAQGFVTKPFEVPSCCSCVITMSVPNYDRIGDLNTTPANTTRRITAGANAKVKSNH